jgi:hypothetical protein
LGSSGGRLEKHLRWKNDLWLRHRQLRLKRGLRHRQLRLKRGLRLKSRLRHNAGARRVKSYFVSVQNVLVHGAVAFAILGFETLYRNFSVQSQKLVQGDDRDQQQDQQSGPHPVVVNAQKKRNALLRDALVVFALQ